MLMINYHLFMLRYSSGNYWAAEIYRVIILTFYLLPRLSLAEMRHLPSNDVNPPPLLRLSAYFNRFPSRIYSSAPNSQQRPRVGESPSQRNQITKVEAAAATLRRHFKSEFLKTA